MICLYIFIFGIIRPVNSIVMSSKSKRVVAPAKKGKAPVKPHPKASTPVAASSSKPADGRSAVILSVGL